MHIFLSCRRS